MPSCSKGKINHDQRFALKLTKFTEYDFTGSATLSYANQDHLMMKLQPHHSPHKQFCGTSINVPEFLRTCSSSYYYAFYI
jgi:hypothetical protein